MEFGLFRPTPAVSRLLTAVVGLTLAGWLLQAAIAPDYLAWMVADPQETLHGQVWRLVSYMFAYVSPVLFFFDLLALWLLGPMIERALGSRRFYQLFFACGLSAAVGMVVQSLLLPATQPAWLGATPAILGLEIAFAALFPEEIILLFFFLPAKGKYFGVVAAAMTWLLLRMPAGAVLGSVLAAVVLVRYQGRLGRSRRFRWPWQKRKASRPSRLQFVPAPREKVTPIRPELRVADLSQDERQVDLILDKLRSHGMASLTPDEKATLESHSMRLRQRDEN